MFKELILADFRERTRRYSFLATLGFVLFYAWLVITGQYGLTLGECRGVYNAAWTGSLMAIGSTSLLMLFGFYLVNNSIRRDRQTGVGEILTATSLGKFPYLMAKFLSNLLVLASMIAILIPAALAMQILVGVTENFGLWAFLSPFLLISLPMIIFISAVAVLFESVRWLRGTLGNIIYFCLFQLLLIISIESPHPALDVLGASTIIPHMQAAAATAYPDARIGVTMGFLMVAEGDPGPLLLFTWNGYPWPVSVVLAKLALAGLSLLLVLLAAACFRGFGQPEPPAKPAGKRKPAPVPEEGPSPSLRPQPLLLEPVIRQFNLPALVKAELRVMLKGVHRIWYLIALALMILPLALPEVHALRFVLPAAWVWPLTLWSALGTREHRFGTRELLACSPRPLTRQLPAAWLAGVLLTLAMGAGMLLRCLLTGEFLLFLALLVAAFFIPTLALTLGKLSGSKKLFEIVYLLLWYLGPVSQLPALNFMATGAEVARSPVPALYLVLTLLLLGVLPLISRRAEAI